MAGKSCTPKSGKKPPWSRDDLDRHKPAVDRAFRDTGVGLAYVFGSLARGREPDRKAISDLDIAVVFPDNFTKEQTKDAWYTLRAALERIFCREDFDLVVANGSPAALRFRIMRDRDLIWCISAEFLSRFETEARRDWQDMQYFRKIQRNCLERSYGVDQP